MHHWVTVQTGVIIDYNGLDFLDNGMHCWVTVHIGVIVSYNRLDCFETMLHIAQ